jgi:hypothetical protein
MMGTLHDPKLCRGCGEVKPRSEFYAKADPRRPNRRESRCRDCYQGQVSGRYAVARTQALVTLGGRCVRCGIDNLVLLVIDHVVALMGARRPSSYALFREVAAGAPGYQLLCHNCNFLKRLEQGEFGGRRVA